MHFVIHVMILTTPGFHGLSVKNHIISFWIFCRYKWKQIAKGMFFSNRSYRYNLTIDFWQNFKSSQCWCHLSLYQCKILDCFKIPTCAIFRLCDFFICRLQCRECGAPGHHIFQQRHLECASMESGSRLNIKAVYRMYGDSHVEYKTVTRPSYL